MQRKWRALVPRMPIPISLTERTPITVTASAEEGRQPGRETDHKPLREIKGLEEDFLGSFKRFAERGEDFDAALSVLQASAINLARAVQARRYFGIELLRQLRDIQRVRRGGIERAAIGVDAIERRGASAQAVDHTLQ